MYSFIQRWFKHGSSPLDRMRLGPSDGDRADLNPLMVRLVFPKDPLFPSLACQQLCCFQIQFFTWDTLQDDVSWWKYFENEVPRLVQLGFTQVWLPPMNKAAEKVSGFF